MDLKLNMKQAEINVDENGNLKKATLTVPIVKPETKKTSIKATGVLNMKKNTVAIKGSDLKSVTLDQYKKIENALVKNLLDGTQLKKSKLEYTRQYMENGEVS